MSTLLKRLYLGVFAISVPTICAGDMVPWLYEVTLPVASQRVNEINRVQKVGLETVLERLTGERNIKRTPTINSALQNAQNFVLQHSFGVTRADAENQTTSQFATIEYDPAAIKDLVRTAGLPLWTANRPAVLIWLTHVENGSFQFVEGDSNPDHPLVQAVRNAALARGLEIRWGEKSVPDYGVYNFADHLLVHNWEFTRLASKYKVDVVLAIDLTPFQSHFLVRSSIPFGIPIAPIWSDIFDNSVGAVESVVHTLADELAALYRVESRGIFQFEILVENVERIEVYQAVVQYLNTWEFIDRVELTSVRGTSFRFTIYASSSREQFFEHIMYDGRLESTSKDTRAGATISLTYRGS